MVNIQSRALRYRVQVTQLRLFQWVLSTPSVYHLILSRPRHNALLYRFIEAFSWFALVQSLLLLGHYWISHKRVKISRARIVCAHVCLNTLTSFERLMRKNFALFFLFRNSRCDHVWARTWNFITVELARINEIGLFADQGFGFVLLFGPRHRKSIFIRRWEVVLFGLMLDLINLCFSISVFMLPDGFKRPWLDEIGLIWVKEQKYLQGQVSNYI